MRGWISMSARASRSSSVTPYTSRRDLGYPTSDPSSPSSSNPVDACTGRPSTPPRNLSPYRLRDGAVRCAGPFELGSTPALRVSSSLHQNVSREEPKCSRKDFRGYHVYGVGHYAPGEKRPCIKTQANGVRLSRMADLMPGKANTGSPNPHARIGFRPSHRYGPRFGSHRAPSPAGMMPLPPDRDATRASTPDERGAAPLGLKSPLRETAMKTPARSLRSLRSAPMSKDTQAAYFRLSPSVRPTRYDAFLSVDSTTKSFSGKLLSSLSVGEPTREIVLHAGSFPVSGQCERWQASRRKRFPSRTSLRAKRWSSLWRTGSRRTCLPKLSMMTVAIEPGLRGLYEAGSQILATQFEGR